MKHPRSLTPEELLLWRESNAATKKMKKAAQAHPPTQDVRPALSDRSSVDKQHPALRENASKPMTKHLPKTPLTPLPARMAKRALKPHGPVEATLDLHGLTKLEAYTKVQHFIIHQQRMGHRHVAIITGKGRAGEAGILRISLPHWLNEASLRPLVSAFATARAEKGGTGVLHVLLKRPS